MKETGQMKGMLKGTLIAVAAAGLFACKSGGESSGGGGSSAAASGGGGGAASGGGEMVKCAGVNECKGQGKCGAPGGAHDCAGKNECKGKGWVEVSSADCTAKGGTVVSG